MRGQVTVRQWQEESTILLKWQLLKTLRGAWFYLVKKKKMLNWPPGLVWHGKRKLTLGHLIKTSKPRSRTEDWLASAAHFIQTSTEMRHYSQKSHTLVCMSDRCSQISHSISVSRFWPILIIITLHTAILQSSWNSNSQLLKISEQAKFFEKWHNC